MQKIRLEIHTNLTNDDLLHNKNLNDKKRKYKDYPQNSRIPEQVAQQKQVSETSPLLLIQHKFKFQYAKVVPSSTA